MKKMFCLEEMHSNCFFPLFRSNLTAKFDKKQAIFQENKLKFRFPLIFLNIPRNLPEYSLDSLIAFPGIFNKIPENLLELSSESSQTFPGMRK